MQSQNPPSLPSYLQQRASIYKIEKARQSKRQPVTYADLKVLDKQAKLVKFVLNPIQDYLEDALTGRDLILKARQPGVSTYFVARHFRRAVNQLTRGAVIAHDHITTEKLRRMQARFFHQLDARFGVERDTDNKTLVTYPLVGSEITSLSAGNATTGLGGTYDFVHFSEASKTPNAEDVITGVMQGLPLDGEAYIESTANGASGHFYDLCMTALNAPEDSIWSLHFFEWWWTPEYRIELAPGETLRYDDEESELVRKHDLTPEQIKWRRYKRKELPNTFLQEYPEDIITAFLTSGRGVFDIQPGMLRDDTPTPQDDPVYVMGIDWGQQNDYTAISIFDVNDYKEVYLTRMRHRSWASILDDIIQLCHEWHIEKVEAERNAMGPLVEQLVHALDGIAVEGFNMTNRSKDILVKKLQGGLNEDDLILLDIKYATQELRAFETRQTPTNLWTYSHPSGGHDDTVIARMLANKAALDLAV